MQKIARVQCHGFPTAQGREDPGAPIKYCIDWTTIIPESVLRNDIKIEMDEIEKRLSDKQRKLSAKPAEVVANVWRRQAKGASRQI